MQKSFMAAALSSSVSLGPGMGAAMGGLSAEVGGNWIFCPGKVLHAGPGPSPAFC